MALYLGDQIISSNPTGTGALYLGEQNICNAYLGTAQVFDNCALANTNVQLQYTGSFSSGNSPGQITLNPPDGYTISGQPGTTGTLTLFTPTYPSSGYFCDGGCPDVNPKSISYTFPSSGTTIINSVRSGGISSNVAQYTDNLEVSSGVGNVSPTVSPTTITGPAGDTYSVTVTFTKVAGITYSGMNVDSNAMTDNGSTFSWTTTNTIASPGATYAYVVGGTSAATQYSYTFNFTTSSLVNATAAYSISGGSGGSGSAPASSITVTGALNTSVSATLTATSNSGYNDPSGGFTYSPSQSITKTLGVDSGASTIDVSGTSTQNVNTLTVSTYSGGCANDACIYGSGSSTVYYTGSLPTSVFSNSSLSSPYSNGIYKISSGGALNVSGGTGSQESCISNLNTFNNIGSGGTSTSACQNASGSADVYFGTGGFQTSSPLYSNNTGCTTSGSGFWSNGSQWIETNSSGVVIDLGPC